MLRELSVQNLALIEDVRVELQPGFCVWTGETGAGKSLLLGALGLLLGDRGSTDLLRAGADELRVAGRFEIETPQRRKAVETVLHSILEQNEVILARRLTRTGRSQAYVNDQPAAVSTLRQVGELLVDVHGQRESESLLHPAYQLQLLDAFGGLEEPRQVYLKQAEKVRELRRHFAELSAVREQRQRELALIRFEREELDQAALAPGEVAGKSRERERLAHAQNLRTFAEHAAGQLYDEDGSVVERLGRLQREAQSWAAVDPGLEEVVRRLEEMQTEVQEATRTLRRLSQHWEADPERLEAVEQRLTFLKRLETKYRRSVDDLIAYRSSLDEQETRLQKDEEDLEGIQEQLATEYAQLRAAAADLSKRRKKIAKRLAVETQKQLAELGMADARLEAVLDPVPLGDDPAASEVPAWGAERLELTLAANPGEPALPLRKVASGGELSRSMLALKTVLAGHDQIETLVFDEIDANVGGRLGDAIGQKLAALGRTHQVVCVTHLPQVASYARWHWTIHKACRGGRTLTEIHPLADAERLEELASMMRGAARGETTRQEAAAMLEAARRSW
ncbi:MAG TPA: DNA repair protein RecN [Gemmataceae bacterium]|nr:DNA repair protein RecN [Gemmataceae bacterium]